MIAELEIQKTLYDSLRQRNALTALLGGQHIFDDIPDAKPLPYIVFGEVETLDWSTDTEGGVEHFIELEIWSEQNGRKEALQIAGEARSALDSLCETLPAAMTNHRLVNLATQSTFTSRQEKNRVFRTVLTVRAVSEPIHNGSI